MRATAVISTAILFLFFGGVVNAPCLSRAQGEKKDSVRDGQSKATQPQQRPPQEPRQSSSSMQSPSQGKPEPPINSPQHQYQHVDPGQQERTQQRQPPPNQPQNQSNANRPNQAEMGNQNRRQPQDFDRNRPRPPFDTQHGRRDGDNRDGRDNERPGYHRDDRHDHHDDWQERRARDWRSDHRTWEQRGGYRGYRIPQDRFGRNFGPRHFFRIHNLPVLVFSGYPGFLYGGYWFRLVDPWPEYWADDWYETDDVYIEYGGDGYYLYNRRYPGVGVAISISR